MPPTWGKHEKVPPPLVLLAAGPARGRGAGVRRLPGGPSGVISSQLPPFLLRLAGLDRQNGELGFPPSTPVDSHESGLFQSLLGTVVGRPGQPEPLSSLLRHHDT